MVLWLVFLILTPLFQLCSVPDNLFQESGNVCAAEEERGAEPWRRAGQFCSLGRFITG